MHLKFKVKVLTGQPNRLFSDYIIKYKCEIIMIDEVPYSNLYEACFHTSGSFIYYVYTM